MVTRGLLLLFAVLGSAASAAAAATEATAAPATASEASALPAAKEEKTSVLLLDLAPTNVGEDEARIITDILSTALSSQTHLDVLTSSDLRQAVGLEQERQMMGCDDDGSCMAEVAGALGADLVVFGSVGRLGAVTVVNLNVFDSARTRSAGRRTIEVRSLEDLPVRLREVVSELTGTFRPEQQAGASATAQAASNDTTPFTSPLFLGGTALVGVGVLGSATALALAYVAHAGVRDPKGTDKDSTMALRDGLVVGSAALLIVAVGGAGVSALAFLE